MGYDGWSPDEPDAPLLLELLLLLLELLLLLLELLLVPVLLLLLDAESVEVTDVERAPDDPGEAEPRLAPEGVLTPVEVDDELPLASRDPALDELDELDAPLEDVAPTEDVGVWPTRGDPHATQSGNSNALQRRLDARSMRNPSSERSPARRTIPNAWPIGARSAVDGRGSASEMSG